MYIRILFISCGFSRDRRIQEVIGVGYYTFSLASSIHISYAITQCRSANRSTYTVLRAGDCLLLFCFFCSFFFGQCSEKVFCNVVFPSTEECPNFSRVMRHGQFIQFAWWRKQEPRKCSQWINSIRRINWQSISK